VTKSGNIKRTGWGRVLHGTFQVGLALKAFDGLLETLGGVLAWFITPAHADHAIRIFCHYDPVYDCSDFFARQFIAAAHDLAGESKLFACIFLLSHGVTKLVLVISLWLGKLWAYPLMIFVFGGFAIYQTFRFAHTHSLGLLLITILDILIVWLTIREYREQLQVRHAAPDEAANQRVNQKS
jgi:uncharacterized membrane protein